MCARARVLERVGGRAGALVCAGRQHPHTHPHIYSEKSTIANEWKKKGEEVATFKDTLSFSFCNKILPIPISLREVRSSFFLLSSSLSLPPSPRPAGPEPVLQGESKLGMGDVNHWMRPEITAYADWQHS